LGGQKDVGQRTQKSLRVPEKLAGAAVTPMKEISIRQDEEEVGYANSRFRTGVA
jgi:hypothetical protein